MTYPRLDKYDEHGMNLYVHKSDLLLLMEKFWGKLTRARTPKPDMILVSPRVYKVIKKGGWLKTKSPRKAGLCVW